MVKDALSFTINNRCFTVHGVVFIQIIGITLELRPVPFPVNFSFLCFNERRWLLNLQKLELIFPESFARLLDSLMMKVL